MAMELLEAARGNDVGAIRALLDNGTGVKTKLFVSFSLFE